MRVLLCVISYVVLLGGTIAFVKSATHRKYSEPEKKDMGENPEIPKHIRDMIYQRVIKEKKGV